LIARLGQLIQDEAKVDFVFDKLWFDGPGHLFLGFYIICVVIRCALSQIMWVLFVFLICVILYRVCGTILLHIPTAVFVDVDTEKNFIVFIS
jgi:hypothetical protein